MCEYIYTTYCGNDRVNEEVDNHADPFRLV